MKPAVPPNVHSADYFGESRDYWWNADFLALMAQRWDVSSLRDVLDVGCGLGHWGRALLPVLPKDARLCGIDREIASVAEARQRGAAFGDRVRYVASAVEHLPFDDASFDFVTCQTRLIHVADPAVALAEMRRVLRPGGLLVAVEPVNLACGGALQLRARGGSLDDVRALWELQLRCEEGKRRLGEGDNSLGEQRPGLVQHAGFANVRVHQTDRPWPLLPHRVGPSFVSSRCSNADRDQHV
jgi:SAM-dependent methyltransferase